MNVQKNIWYGAKRRDSEATHTYEKLITLLKIEHLAKRYIQQLSGGENNA